jgi:hypothetical protein
MITKLHLIHASGNTFMPLHMFRDDVDMIVRRGPHLAILTECGQPETMAAVRQAVSHRMRVFNPDGGDIAFLLSFSCHPLATGGPLVIPKQSGPAQEGGHGPRHNSYIQFELGDEVITHTGVHFVTAHENHKDNTGDRRDEQVKQAVTVGQQMQRFGKGSKVSTGSGDINGVLPARRDLQAVYDQYGLTTTAEEVGNDDPTHGNRQIDYIWTYDKDRRVTVDHMQVLRGFHSDHRPVEAWLRIAVKR